MASAPAGQARLSEAERRAIGRYILAQGAFSLAGLAALASLLALALWMISAGERGLAGPWVLGVPVLVLWCALLALAPVRLARALGDLRQGAVSTVQGLAQKDRVRRPGLIAPLAGVLVIDGRRFRVPEPVFRAVPADRRVRVRFAARSGAFLSWAGCEDGPPPPGLGEAAGDLTRREREILDLLAEGCTDKEIARRLNLSPATVRGYNSELYAKLGVTNRTQAAACARPRG